MRSPTIPSSLWVLLALSACAPGQVARQVRPAALGASAAPVAQAPPAVCTLSGWRAVPLATQAGAPRYAVFSGEDELALLPGAAHALVSAERGGLTLRGWVALADFPVSIKRELVVDGYLALSAGHEAHVEAVAGSGEITVRVVPPRRLLPAAPLRVALRCADLVLSGSGGMPARALLPPPPAEEISPVVSTTAGHFELAEGVPVPLSRTSTGEVVAVYRPWIDLAVDVLEKEGGAARVVIEDGTNVALLGWVDRGLLHRVTGAPSPVGISLGTLGHGASWSRGRRRWPSPPPPPGERRCAGDLQVAALIAGRRVVVGALRANTRFVPGDAQDGWVALRLGAPFNVDLAPGVSLWLPLAARACPAHVEAAPRGRSW